MSNLQCPVTVILTSPGDAPGLAERLRDERITTIWSDPQTPARHAAEVIATELGVTDVRVHAATVDELESLADEFRGEAVLGIVPEPVLVDLLGQLFRSGSAEHLISDGLCRASYDGEGWTISR